MGGSHYLEATRAVLRGHGGLWFFDGSYAISHKRNAALARRGFRRIALACYPEPHRKIDQAKLEATLGEKLDAVAADDMARWLISQFCLDAAPIVALAEWLRARGIAAPLRIGIAGPADRRTLWKYALSCGIGASIRALGAGAAEWANALLTVA